MWLTVVLSLVLIQSTFAAYSLVEEYKGENFFDGFNLVNWNEDSTFTDFVMDYNDAYSMGLINTSSTQTYIGVDHTNKVNGNQGRKSIQIMSKKNWTEALWIGDIQHMPGGLCGVWPGITILQLFFCFILLRGCSEYRTQRNKIDSVNYTIFMKMKHI